MLLFIQAHLLPTLQQQNILLLITLNLAALHVSPCTSVDIGAGGSYKLVRKHAFLWMEVLLLAITSLPYNFFTHTGFIPDRLPHFRFTIQFGSYQPEKKYAFGHPFCTPVLMENRIAIRVAMEGMNNYRGL